MSTRKIDTKVMENIEILSKLELEAGERERVMEELERIINFADKLNDVDTENVEPLVHITSEVNVFREDIITNCDGRETLLDGAPACKDNQIVVPKTL